MEIMEAIGFMNVFHGSCYHFHGNIKVFAEELCTKTFSSVFEAHASKAYEPPTENMISMHVVRGPAKRKAPLSPNERQRVSLRLLIWTRGGLLLQLKDRGGEGPLPDSV